MATAMYKLKVIEVSQTAVKIDVEIVSPDEYYFYVKKNFALQILWEAAPESSALKKAVTIDEILEPDWVINHQDEFIASITMPSYSNYPADKINETTSKQLEEMRKEKGNPKAVFLITVTDVKWIEYLKAGFEWETASYDMEDDL